MRHHGCLVWSRFIHMEADTQAEMWKYEYIKQERGKKNLKMKLDSSLSHIVTDWDPLVPTVLL